MKGCRKILIAVNGSKEVLRQGLKLSEDEHTWITVVKVVPENAGGTEPDRDQEYRRRA